MATVTPYSIISVFLALLFGCSIIGVIFNSYYGTSGPSLAFSIPFCFRNSTVPGDAKHILYADVCPENTSTLLPKGPAIYKVPITEVEGRNQSVFFRVKGQSYTVTILRVQTKAKINISLSLNLFETPYTFNISQFDESGNTAIYPKNYNLLVYEDDYNYTNGNSSCVDFTVGCRQHRPFSVDRQKLNIPTFENDNQEILIKVTHFEMEGPFHAEARVYVRLDPASDHPQKVTGTILLAVASFAGIIVPFSEGFFGYLIDKARA